MKKLLLHDFVYTFSSLLTLLAIYTLPVASGKAGYIDINWTWDDLDDVGIASFGEGIGLIILVIAVAAELANRFLKNAPIVFKILNITYVVLVLLFCFATYGAVGEGAIALTGLPLYVLLLGGGWWCKYEGIFTNS